MSRETVSVSKTGSLNASKLSKISTLALYVLFNRGLLVSIDSAIPVALALSRELAGDVFCFLVNLYDAKG